ncbi:MAG: sigma-70 family RNA polymerase sigma factor [Planctomycetota bacterium]
MNPESLAAELESASEHMEWLQALAVSMVADRHTAEDLVQRALQEASCKQSWEPGRLRSWLSGVVRNLAKQHFRTESRRRAREQRVVERAEIRAKGIRDADAVPLPEELAQQVEAQNLLSGGVMDLPEKYRTVMLQFYYGEWSQKKIADFHGLSVRSVETRLRRGREQLRERLEGEYGKDSWALGLMPLLLRIPPPQLPPPITAAGAGSVGTGWWTSLAAGLAFCGWLALPKAADPVEPPALAQTPEITPQPQDLLTATRAIERQAQPTEGPTPEPPTLLLDDDILRIQCLERGSGKTLADHPVRLSFLRELHAKETIAPSDPRYFSPRDRVFVRLGDGHTRSDAQGLATLEMPEGTTILYLTDGLHSPTHSRVAYARGGIALPRPPAAMQPLPLECVRRTGNASGYVLNAEGQPIADAVVDVLHYAPQLALPAPTLSVLTEADGSFDIPNIACDQGGFLLRPRKPGYATTRSLRMERYAGFGKDYPGISLTLESAPTPLQVSVMDAEGQALAGAQITLTDLKHAQLPRYEFGAYLAAESPQGRSDEEGTFAIQNRPQGRLRLEVRLPGYLPWSAEVEAGVNTQRVFLKRGASLQLLLQPENGGDLSGAIVGLHQQSGSRYLTIGNDAIARFHGLRIGEDISITVVHPDFALAGWQHWKVRADFAEEVLSLHPALELQGSVILSPKHGKGKLLPRLFVAPQDAAPLAHLQQPDGTAPTFWQLAGIDAVMPNAKGEFHFYGLPAADLEVWFGHRRRPLARTTARSGDKNISLQEGQGMEAFAQVQLQVRERKSGRPISQYYLVWRSDLDGVVETLPLTQVRDPEGRHQQLGLPPGAWSLWIWAPQGYTTLQMPARHFPAGPTTLELDLLAARSLKVQLRDQYGQPIPGAEIQVQDARGHVLLQGGRQGTDALPWQPLDAQGRVVLSQVPLEESYRLVGRIGDRTEEFVLPASSAEGELRTLTWVL